MTDAELLASRVNLAALSPKVRAWIESDSPYRPAYFCLAGGGPKTHSKDTDPWTDLPVAEVEAWRARDLSNRWATSDRTARALAWLEREFSGRPR